MLIVGAAPLVLVTTGFAYGNFVSVVPQPVMSGQTLTVVTDNWEPVAALAFYWNNDMTAPIATSVASDGGTDTVMFTVPPEPDGRYDLAACETAPQASCTTTAVHYTVQVGSSPPSPSPTPPPTSPTASPTPATPITATQPPATALPATPAPTAAPVHHTPRPGSATKPAPAPPPTPTPAATPAPTASVAATPSTTPVPAVVAPPPSATPGALVPYDPTSEPKKVVDAQVAAFTLLALGAGSGGLAVASAVGGAAGFELRRQGLAGGKVQSATVKQVTVAGADTEAPGDSSWTWRFPGTGWLDAVSVALPVRLATRSPLLARILVDGGFLRSMLGSLTLLLDAAGVALGILAVQSVSGHALPPSAVLTIAIAVLGVIDAFAGLLSVGAFVVGVAVLGGINSAASVRELLGLCALWTVVPLLAGAARPLRREPARTMSERWDRSADFVIASLVGAWAVQKIVVGLPGLAGYRLPIAQSANAAAIAVLAALVVRMGLESIAARWYPARLSSVYPATVPRPGPRQRLLAALLRTAVFAFIAVVVVGPSWQLWLGMTFFLVPQVLGIYENRLRNVPSIYRVMPRGLLKLVLLLLVARLFGAMVLATIHDSRTAIADAFVLLSLPGLFVSLLDLFGRDGPGITLRWRQRIGGVALLAAGVLLVAGAFG